MTESRLQHAIRDGIASGDLAEALTRRGEAEIATQEDAAAVAVLLVRHSEAILRPNARGQNALHHVIALFQQVESREAFQVLAERGLPALRSLFDVRLAAPMVERWADDLIFLVKILALYRDPQDLPRIAAAARDGALAGKDLWLVIFQTFDDEHPLRHELLEALRDPLPTGFAAVAYLDFANALARQQSLEHPFNRPAGHGLLEEWLTDSSERRRSDARSAAAALPFITDPPRAKLLALGLDHPAAEVQMETAWASAKIGSRAGLDVLTRACLDVRSSAIAVAYLEELGEFNAVPARAKNPDFAAVAEMCRWLAHPMEYGRPPDTAELLDARTLVWPPANGPRRLWLVKYRYAAARPDGADDVGLGLVGSITFALLDETDLQASPEDAYALHCCWELEVENDPRAPETRSVAAGRQLLREAGNAGF